MSELFRLTTRTPRKNLTPWTWVQKYSKGQRAGVPFPLVRRMEPVYLSDPWRQPVGGSLQEDKTTPRLKAALEKWVRASRLLTQDVT
jgi:hypothetical protein